jgi:hypothetical protein
MRSAATESRLRPSMNLRSCFGTACRLMGQSLVPDPPAMIIA